MKHLENVARTGNSQRFDRRRESLFGDSEWRHRGQAIRSLLNNSPGVCLPSHNPDLGCKSCLKFQNSEAAAGTANCHAGRRAVATYALPPNQINFIRGLPL